MAAMLMPGLGYEASAQTPQYIPTDSTATTSPQRHITPVENTDGRSPKPTLHYYDQHGNPLKEPVAVWVQEDTVRVNRVPKQPLFNGVNIGINFFDAILKIAGQSYGNYDIWASISLHNWIFPTLEAGLGYADSSPKNKNYTYHCDPSLYIKIGAD